MPILTKLKEILDEAKVIFNHRLPTPRRKSPPNNVCPETKSPRS